ncbi:sensor histidine kinase [Filimonas effusa]|uniref:histidine kinase n=1 Tax=Filimonas effusa TaxID=2508721 RepID=A0A4Q1DAZ1_9BACT|nr:HAMP domain-containing sensor histidine kinase [Filimonas effusa]RXK85659.1 HAMP domain-containing histidine kinase [Filimonas effusa]
MNVKFLNILSHELRSPLTTIQTSSEILEQLANADAVDTDTMKRHTQRIMDEVADMALLLEKVLLMSRAHSTRSGFNPVISDPASLIKELAGRPFVRGKQFEKTAFEIKGTPRQALIDPFMFSHIVNGLVDNAFKYSARAESLVPRVRVSFTDAYWRVMVIDNGIGIKKADKKNLFRSFSRGSNVADIQGTGLGLEIIRYFVRCHKGEISLRSLEGKGTVVIVDLPY